MPPQSVCLQVDSAPFYGKMYTYTEVWNGRRFQYTSPHPWKSEVVVRRLVHLAGATHTPSPRPRVVPMDVPREM